MKLYSHIKKILKIISYRIPLQNIIIFESNPDYSCNTYPVFLELRRRLPNYKMVWMTSEKSVKAKGVDDVYYRDKKDFYNRQKRRVYRFLAKALISCNRYKKMGSVRAGQVSLFLAHGSVTKDMKRKGFNYNPGVIVDYIDNQSHYFDDVMCYQYEAKKEQLVYLGYPRCDWFYKENNIVDQLKKIDIEGDYLIWLPTFRKNKTETRDVHSEKYENLGIPLIYTVEKLVECNDFLCQHNLHIIFKPHPIQDISTLTKTSLSNIHIISDEILNKLGLQLYQVIAGSKALISDYSSVFFDYLLLDRPMATTVDDVEQWKDGEGFAYDLECLYNKATEKVATLDELYSFIQDVVIGNKDTKHEARQQICKETNMYDDGYSAIRVADFIMEKIGEV
ncbi:MAG: CDP-glycerol glycerophosphotransferase family protein [Bacteroidaceae bacterium]|nr:CDP-glycerol glycerophosphotransferase family protein [Bacteroidaceae bacterium]